MLYILNEEEYQKLVSDKVERALIAQGKLQKLCTRICNEMPIKWGGYVGHPDDDPKPWVCIHSLADEWYCDQCPMIEICPTQQKKFSSDYRS